MTLDLKIFLWSMLVMYVCLLVLRSSRLSGHEGDYPITRLYKRGEDTWGMIVNCFWISYVCYLLFIK